MTQVRPQHFLWLVSWWSDIEVQTLLLLDTRMEMFDWGGRGGTGAGHSVCLDTGSGRREKTSSSPAFRAILRACRLIKLFSLLFFWIDSKLAFWGNGKQKDTCVNTHTHKQTDSVNMLSSCSLLVPFGQPAGDWSTASCVSDEQKIRCLAPRLLYRPLVSSRRHTLHDCPCVCVCVDRHRMTSSTLNFRFFE